MLSAYTLERVLSLFLGPGYFYYVWFFFFLYFLAFLCVWSRNSSLCHVARSSRSMAFISVTHVCHPFSIINCLKEHIYTFTCMKQFYKIYFITKIATFPAFHLKRLLIHCNFYIKVLFSTFSSLFSSLSWLLSSFLSFS